nr:MAG TPA: hypothetical protein [Caudoviricetes sp.]DAV37728.1 MAG TPA: hypothetical protein [Bacteriophage sp.]
MRHNWRPPFSWNFSIVHSDCSSIIGYIVISCQSLFWIIVEPCVAKFS